MHAGTSIGLATADAAAALDTPRIVLRIHPQLPLLAFPEGVALEVLADPMSIRIPNTRPWFGGAVGLRGNLLPILDLAAWAGHGIDTGKRRLLAVSSSQTPFALLSADIPQLLSVASTDALRVDARDTEALGALGAYLGVAHTTRAGTAHEFDMHAWIAEVRRDLAGGASL